MPPPHTHTHYPSGNPLLFESLGREESRSSGLIITGLKYQAKRFYFNSVAKITSSYGNLHFHNAVQLLIVP